MSRRVDIVNEFTEYLRAGPFAQVVRGFRYMADVNEFPFITYIIVNSVIAHIGDNVRYSSLEINLRGYVREEDSLGAADQLLLDLEDYIQDYRMMSNPSYQVAESRIINARTDEGLMNPIGVVEMDILIVYQHDILV